MSNCSFLVFVGSLIDWSYELPVALWSSSTVKGKLYIYVHIYYVIKLYGVISANVLYIDV